MLQILSPFKPQIRWRILSRLPGGKVAAARSLGLTVGEGCRIISCQVRSEYDLVSIGDRVTVSSEVLFITHDGAGWLANDQHGRRYRVAPIRVGSDSFIGARSIIMPGVEIGRNCIVAAGTVVTKSVPDGLIVGGNPARVIGSTDRFIQTALQDWSTGRSVDRTMKLPLDRE